MKKILTAIAAAVFLLLPAPVFSAYIIHLKDGTKFVTDQYFEEGDQIRFKRYGGLIGVEKDRIREIEETEDPAVEKDVPAELEEAPAPKEAEIDQRAAEGSKEAQSGQEGRGDVVQKQQAAKDKLVKSEAKKDKKEAVDKNIDIERYKKEKIVLLRKKQEVLQEYRKAGEQGDEATKAEAKRMYKDINNQLSDLAMSLRAENGGMLPSWWNEIKPEKE